MRKFLAASLSTVMLLSSGAGVMAADLEVPVEIPESFKMNYGITMTTPDQSMEENIEMVASGNQAKASLYMKTESDEMTMELELPDYIYASDSGAYLNASSIVKAVEKNMEMGSLDMYARMLGVTEEWVKLEPIHPELIQWNVKPYDGEIPEFDDETLQELSDIGMSLLKVSFDENGLTYSVSDKEIKEFAAAMDTFKEENLGFVGDILTYVVGVIADSANVDIKPAIREYLDAVAEGYMAANPDVTEADAKAYVDALVDGGMEQGFGVAAEQLKEVPVAEIWNSLSFAALADQMLTGGFEAKLVMGEEITFEITAGEGKFGGTIEIVDEKFVVTLKDAEGNTVASMELTATDDGAVCEIKDAEGTTQVVTSCEFGAENGYYDMTVPSENVDIHVYYNIEEWSNDGSLKDPEAYNSVLEVIKSVSQLMLTTYETEE